MVFEPYLRLSVRGTLPGGESWSINPTFYPKGGSTISTASLNAALTAAKAVPIGTAFNNVRGVPAPITSGRLELRQGVKGTLVDAVEQTWANTSATSATKPYQTALVLSMRTGLVGHSNRGRLYWPALGAAIGANDLRIVDASCQQYAQQAYEWLTGIASAISGSGILDTSLAVISNTTGARSDVQYIEVGNVLDVQRRRRDKAVESRFRYPA